LRWQSASCLRFSGLLYVTGSRGTLADRSGRAVLDHAVFIAVVATVIVAVASMIWLVSLYFA
jgi:hypothetical protein